MQMLISNRSGDLTDAIRQHIHDRLYAALDQHASRVNQVRLVIEDANGPRGGYDQVCRVAVRLNNGTTLHHERRGLDLYANVSLIADKVKRRVGRRIAQIRRKRA